MKDKSKSELIDIIKLLSENLTAEELMDIIHIYCKEKGEREES